MSSDRVEYAMVGVFVEELPFDEGDEKYMPYVCHMDNEPIWVVRLFSCNDDNPGFVIGTVVKKSVSECACSILTEIPKNIGELRYRAFLGLTERLEMDIKGTDVKLYTFITWN